MSVEELLKASDFPFKSAKQVADVIVQRAGCKPCFLKDFPGV